MIHFARDDHRNALFSRVIHKQRVRVFGVAVAQGLQFSEQGRPELPLLELTDDLAALKLRCVFLRLKFRYPFSHANHDPSSDSGDRRNNDCSQGLSPENYC